MRKIFVLLAWIVDANGAYHTLDGYPKVFDSKNYGNDPAKALLRAKGDFHGTIGDMCKVDSRKIQTIILMGEDGFVIDTFTTGSLAESEVAEPEE